jgi:hypothetical protein
MFAFSEQPDRPVALHLATSATSPGIANTASARPATVSINDLGKNHK